MYVIAIVHHKGGVGKTTTATSLAADLALRGKRVLLVDTDPHAGATKIFTDPDGVSATLAQVLLAGKGAKGAGIREAVTATEVAGLDLVAGSTDLEYYDRTPPSLSSVTRLKECLDAAASAYDFAIVDTPPHDGMLLSAALASAQGVIIPVQAEALPATTISSVLDVIDSARRVNRKLEVLGALCTMFDDRTVIGRQVFDAIRDQFPGRTFKTAIHRQVKLAELAAVNRPIQLHAPSSRGAVEYHALGDEVLEILRGNGNARKARPKKR